MKNFTKACQKFLKDDQGLTTVEYAVAGALVAAAVAAAFTTLGTAVTNQVTGLATIVNAAP